MSFSRAEQLRNLEKEEVFDLLVIGGGIKSLKKITDKFYSNTQYVESYAELVEEGLID